MKTTALIELFGQLDAADITYLVVGGYAVIAHGHLRATHDLDLVVDTRGDQPQRLVELLAAAGFSPRAPVALAAFADPAQRADWQARFDADVFTVIRAAEPIQDELDIFLEPPFDLDAERARALWQPLPSGLRVPFAARDTLIAMKRRAGRDKDLADILALQDRPNA